MCKISGLNVVICCKIFPLTVFRALTPVDGNWEGHRYLKNFALSSSPKSSLGKGWPGGQKSKLISLTTTK